MSGVSLLIKKASERLNLDYTPWEQSFLQNVVRSYTARGSLTKKQETKLKQIVFERWVQGQKP